MTSWLKKYKDVLPDDYTFHKKFIGKYVMPLELKTFPDNFPQVPDSFADMIPDTFPHVPDTFPHVPDNFTHVPDTFPHVPENFAEYVPENFAEYVPENFAEYVPDTIPHISHIPHIPHIPDISHIPHIPEASLPPLEAFALPMYVGTVRPVTAPHDFGTVQLIRYQRYRINRPSTR